MRLAFAILLTTLAGGAIDTAHVTPEDGMRTIRKRSSRR